MDQLELEHALKDLPLGSIFYFPSLPSTNDEAARLAYVGVPNLTLVLADRQTAGRGRKGRTWITHPEASLAFSLVLLPPFPHESDALSNLTALGALAVTGALHEWLHLEAQIKWPNDVLINRKKVSGILAEANWSGDHLLTVILGIGFNVLSSSMPLLPPGEDHFPATSIENELGEPVDRLVLLRKIIEKLLYWRPQVGSPQFLEAWEHSLAFLGEWVQVSVLGFPSPVEYDGQILGLSPDGSLRLKTPDGEEISVNVGEVRLHM